MPFPTRARAARLRIDIAAAVVAVAGALIASAFAASFASAGAAAPPTTEFVVSERQSTVKVHVGKSGAFSFAGHRHVIAAPVTGTIRADPANVGASSVELVFPTARFEVLPEGEPEGDAPKVQEVMRGPRVLDALRFAEVRFRSRRITGTEAPATAASGAANQPAAGPRRFELQVAGDVTIHGVSREVVVPMSVVLEGEILKANGRSTVRHDQFGLTPVTAGGGTVRVSNEIEIDFAIVASRGH